jgi:hypothetical protein
MRLDSIFTEGHLRDDTPCILWAARHQFHLPPFLHGSPCINHGTGFVAAARPPGWSCDNSCTGRRLYRLHSCDDRGDNSPLHDQCVRMTSAKSVRGCCSSALLPAFPLISASRTRLARQSTERKWRRGVSQWKISNRAEQR